MFSLALLALAPGCGSRSGLEPSLSVGECVHGFADCDEDPRNGCETPVAHSQRNCGSCGAACPGGTTCLEGRCLQDGQAASVTSGILFTCALLAPGDVWCWGNNEHGALGRGYASEAEPRPARVVGLSDVVQVSARGRSACALDRRGDIYCWGLGRNNALGNMTSEDEHAPVLAYDVPEPALFAGGGGALVLQRSGTIVGWGYNENGTLGSGDTDTGLSQTKGIRDAVFVSLLGSSCAVRQGGRVACWGYNGTHQVSAAQVEGVYLPVERKMPPARRVDPGYFRTCATLRDGRAMCWGDASSSSIIGEPDEASIVPDLDDVVQTLAGFYHRCALLASGEVHCWGMNNSFNLDRVGGMLGRGFSFEVTVSPKPVFGIHDALGMTVGFSHTCVVRETGQVLCWGSNEDGQLGDGTRDPKATPVVVSGLE